MTPSVPTLSGFSTFSASPAPSLLLLLLLLLLILLLLHLSLQTISCTAEAKAMLDQLVVVKLNGALATPVGCRYVAKVLTDWDHVHSLQGPDLWDTCEERPDLTGPDCSAD